MSAARAMQRYFRGDRPPESIPTDSSRPRVLIRWPAISSIEVRHFDCAAAAYQCWLNLPRGILAAMRNAGESLPIRAHDFVDAY